MKLLEAHGGPRLDEVEVPAELYWVLDSPTPLAGMAFPRAGFPWTRLEAAGLRAVVALHPGGYDPAPLTVAFAEQLEDLVAGGPPRDEVKERAKIERAVGAVLDAWSGGRGVVVHCVGGRGRTGTVLGCALREMGFASAEVIRFLDRVHRARGTAGWPESPWQGAVVETGVSAP